MGANQFTIEKRTDFVQVINARGFTAEKLAEASGLSKSLVYKLCCGEKAVDRIGIANFMRLAKALRMPVPELIKALRITI